MTHRRRSATRFSGAAAAVAPWPAGDRCSRAPAPRLQSPRSPVQAPAPAKPRNRRQRISSSSSCPDTTAVCVCVCVWVGGWVSAEGLPESTVGPRNRCETPEVSPYRPFLRPAYPLPQGKLGSQLLGGGQWSPPKLGEGGREKGSINPGHPGPLIIYDELWRRKNLWALKMVHLYHQTHGK